jgi:ABC-type transporter Mla subunit MlaD
MREEEQQRVHYIHRMSYTTQERMVGVFVLAALAVIFLLVFINSKTAHLFEDYVTFHAYLNNAVGISTDTPVKISGLDVGRVKSIDISPDNRIHLELIVYERYRGLVRTDSKASLGKLSVIGRSMVMIEAGSPERPELPEDTTLLVEEPLSVDELIAELTPVVKAVGASVERFSELIMVIQPEQMQAIAGDLQQSTENIRLISEQVQSGQGALGMMLYDEAFRENFARTIATMDKAFTRAEARLAQLEPTLANIERISGNTGEASTEFPQIAAEFRVLLANANTTLTGVNLEMRELPELISRMKVLMERTDRLLEGISSSWLFSSEESRQRARLIGVQPANE